MTTTTMITADSADDDDDDDCNDDDDDDEDPISQHILIQLYGMLYVLPVLGADSADASLNRR